MRGEGHRAALAAFVLAVAFLALGAFVKSQGVWLFERTLYQAIIDVAAGSEPVFRLVTLLGGTSMLVATMIGMIITSPRDRRPLLVAGVAALLLASLIEGLAKDIVARGRPESVRFGFPSGHTTSAAAFFTVFAYAMAGCLRRRVTRIALCGGAIVVVLIVGLSRIMLRAHWPLDVLGGVLLGSGCAALGAAVCERLRNLPMPLLYRWHEPIVLTALIVALLLMPPPLFIEQRWWLDSLFDAAGSLAVGVGVGLRFWAAGVAGTAVLSNELAVRRLTLTGPYQHLRHPVFAGNIMIAAGIAIVAENMPGILLVATVVIPLYRAVAAFEERFLIEAIGRPIVEYHSRVPRWGVERRAQVTVDTPPPFGWAFALKDLRTAVVAVTLGGLADWSESAWHFLR